ncbi:unnamed protein product [Polarella glacialis]|uniref:TRUD domain-containing protein n=1 Tax=Polarella glacialis TaxID=89957 RepID=A0A813IP39_POLGL|nr:unnamed protein product [Polarella glacialis]
MDCGAIKGIADEDECGISAFANPTLRPIGGILKSYPEDFEVRELPLPHEVSGQLPLDELPYLRFRLQKQGMDTLEAVDVLSAACRVPSRHFGFAGIKDSFAVTTQELTVPRELLSETAVRKAAAETELKVSRFRPCASFLAPGMLAGNRFILRIRDVRVSEKCVGEAMESLRCRGFLNYVGMQRFGKAGVRSDLLGLAYLRGDYEQCVDLLLRQSDAGGAYNEHHFGTGPSARVPRWAEVFKRTNSASAALRAMPEGARWTERRLLTALLRRQDLDGGTALKTAEGAPLTSPSSVNDWADETPQSAWWEATRDAFLTLPKTIRAYVDRLWNLSVTERVTRLSLSEPVRGDPLLQTGGYFSFDYCYF